ncbi:MAG TPA: peptidyl-alpha-hydroxyglycine alpha-amidating lyase family protein [Acidobacteriota bacterium]|nr:peptidyl-alpha-hydroxyglycine alpha-amidating lyase family protein [Acidobacteriota bacterium]
MTRLSRIGFGLLAILVVTAAFTHVRAQNSSPNPYRTLDGVWGELPDNRTWGATSAVYTALDGVNIWVGERCGANTCVGTDMPTIFLFSPDGEMLKSFGGGLFAWPHGMHVDPEGNVWVTDAVGFGEPPEGLGHVVYKFSADGELLMTLGKKGVPGDGEDTFRQPSDVLVAPNGDIFVADGHGAEGNNRIVKLSSDGSFIKAWGKTGQAAGEFRDPHALAMDSQGRLFVGDRRNRRIQVFDQDGNYLATWTQFGGPSGLYIDANDMMYSADSESNANTNPGWKRGIRIGSVTDGFVTAFIPDPEPDQDGLETSAAEGIAADSAGNVYGAEVGPRALRKHVKR